MQGLHLSEPDGWLTPPEPVFGVAAAYVTVASQSQGDAGNFPHLTLVEGGVATAVTRGEFEVTNVYGVAADGLTA